MSRARTTSSDFPIWTEHLRLRPFARPDEDVLLAIFRDDGVRRFLLDGKLVDRDWVRAEIETSIRRFADGGLGIFLAHDRRDDRAIGFAGFRPFREPPVLELLYGLYPAFWGRGLATEMGAAMLALAFEQHGLDAVETTVDAPNVVSLRVLQRLGLSEIDRSHGAFGTTLHYRLTRADWEHGSGDGATKACFGKARLPHDRHLSYSLAPGSDEAARRHCCPRERGSAPPRLEGFARPR